MIRRTRRDTIGRTGGRDGTLSRRALLSAAAAGCVIGATPRALAQVSGARNLVIVWAEGGWDTTYSIDPKLDVSAIEGPEHFDDPTQSGDRNDLRTFGDLRVVVNDLRRPAVTRFFERWSDRAAIVNGIWMGSIAHDPCRLRMLTGTMDPTAVDIAVIAGAVHGADLPLGSVDLSGFSFPGRYAASAGRVGESSQILTLLDPTQTFPPPADVGSAYPLFVPGREGADRIREINAARLARLETRWAAAGPASRTRLADWSEATERATRLRAVGDRLDELELGTAPSFRSSCDVATTLLADGVCRSVFVDSRLQWDTHAFNEDQNEHHEALYDGLAHLMQLVDAKGLIDDTVIAVLSEMTRTPKHNLALGKDHWQHTSALLLGAGVRHGQYGGTDDLLESLPMNLDTGEVHETGELCKYDNFAAGILQLCGVDSQQWLPGTVPFLGARA